MICPHCNATVLSSDLASTPAVGGEPAETWAYIERLLHDECGLRLDEGLEGQRANCINAINNGSLPAIDSRLLQAAIEFLNTGEGLHKIRVNGKMMNRKDVADALAAQSASPLRGRELILEQTSAVAPAVENLARYQEQCDRDGVMVKVSRQALDEVLGAVEAINTIVVLSASPPEQAAEPPKDHNE